MKKLILAGIIIIICCLVFLIVRQNASRADIDMDLNAKTYPVPFGDWVFVYLSAYFEAEDIPGHSFLMVGREVIEGKIRFSISVGYNSNSEVGRRWYQECFPKVKESIRNRCGIWTAEGYPISLNDFQFDIRTF